MKDYTGKTIFLGMDVHKDSYSVTAVYDRQIVKKDRLPADPSNLIRYCQRFFPNAEIYSAYEAGFCGFNLHRFLLKNNIKNIVVDAASIEVQANNKVKTDKRDSLKIAAHLSDGRLKGIYVPSIDQEAQRSVSRLRATVVNEKTRCTNRLKGFLYYLGFKLDFNRMCPKVIKNLRNMDIEPANKFTLNSLLDDWEYYANKIAACDQELQKQAEEDSLTEYYRSVPGVGPTIARVLSNELGDMSQFSNERLIFSYCGLTPSEYSSGETTRKGHITRQGKPHLRMYLTQAAWRAIRKDPSLNDIFERIGGRAGGKRAIIAVARRLIGRIRSCVKNKQYYVLATSQRNNKSKDCDPV